MQIQKRWPALFAAGSVVAYLLNNYTISGFEHLRLQPRQSLGSASTNPTANSAYQTFDLPSQSAFPSSTTPWNASGMRSPGGTLNSVLGSLDTDLGRWSEQLGVGEKLALVQDQMSAKLSELSRSPGTMLPSTSGGLSAPTTSSMAFGNIAQANKHVGAGAPLPVTPLPGTSLPGTHGQTTTPQTSSAASATTAATSFGSSFRGDATPKPIAFSPPSQASKSSMDRVPSIRLATFNLNAFGATKLAKSGVTEIVTSILRQFDVIAIQGIQSDRDDILPVLVERLNISGRRFDYLVGPRVGPPQQTQQYAFIFDTSRVETDRYQLYTVDDPENLMTFDPLVGWFRCIGSSASDAFTFSLVNVLIHRPSGAKELALVPNLFHAVANDGRQEDDLIIAGDFGSNPAQIAQLNSESIRFAVRDIPTEITGQAMQDCILFPTRGTTEFTGKSGAFDFLRKFNLSIEQAMEISSQMPVWAEFYSVEGAHPGRVAPTSSQHVFQ